MLREQVYSLFEENGVGQVGGVFKIKMTQACCIPFSVFCCILKPQIMVYTLLALLCHC